MRALSGPVVMAALLAAVSRRPCGEDGPETSDTEAPVLARKRVPVEENKVAQVDGVDTARGP